MGLDEEMFRAIHEGGRSAALDPFFVALSLLGTLYVWLALAGPLGWRLGPRMAVRLVLLLLVDALLVGALKALVARPRPSPTTAIPVPLDATAGEPSFPSGHASRGMAVAAWLSRSDRRFLPLVPYALLIALSRIYVGVHWPSDVVAGLLLGAAVGWGMSRLFETTTYLGWEDRILAGARRLLGR